MHIPDGYLGPPTYGGLWAVMAGIWLYASSRIRKTLRASQSPLLALAASFSFVIMMFNVPIPAGTTGHATGAVLIAILIGPWPATIAVSVALVMQAVLFGDGGITAIGANCFNIAFAQSFAGWGIYKLLSAGEASSKRKLFSSALGGYIGLNAAAFLTAVELGIQPIMHTAPDGRPLYSPFPLSITVPAVMVEHVALFGILEAVVTAGALSYLMKSHPSLVKGNA